jgi:hypothetical protein
VIEGSGDPTPVDGRSIVARFYKGPPRALPAPCWHAEGSWRPMLGERMRSSPEKIRG